MSKTVVLVAGILVAVGAAAAVSAPSLRGQRHGSLLDHLADGLGRATHQISQAIGVSDEGAAPSREEGRSRRGKRSRDEDQSAKADDKPQREARKGLIQRLVVEIRHAPTRFEDQERAGRDVPRAQSIFPEPIEPSTRNVCQIQRC